jgi:hypothetical protein
MGEIVNEKTGFRFTALAVWAKLNSKQENIFCKLREFSFPSNSNKKGHGV